MNEYEYTPEQRAEILKKMEAASNVFYAMAAAAGCHAFIEFTGLMNEFIKVCRDADAQGLNWIHANVHGETHLPFKPYHIAYLSEKLECIYGRRVQLVEEVPPPPRFLDTNLVEELLSTPEPSRLGECWDCHGCDNCMPDPSEGYP